MAGCFPGPQSALGLRCFLRRPVGCLEAEERPRPQCEQPHEGWGPRTACTLWTQAARLLSKVKVFLRETSQPLDISNKSKMVMNPCSAAPPTFACGFLLGPLV